MEDSLGNILGIEIKATSTPMPKHFNGLRKLATLAGKKFIQGMVLCDHPQVVPFGEKLFVAPINVLWH